MFDVWILISNGQGFEQAFETVYGISLDNFYQEFAAFRANQYQFK